jgi:ChaB
MFHLNESFYKQEMPARAKRLFMKTFKKYHKLDGGDEDVALHMAKQAVDREYVKLNDRWIPKSAAEEIVRHDIDEDSLSEPETPAAAAMTPPPSKNVVRVRNPVARRRLKFEQLSESEDISTDDEDDYDYFDSGKGGGGLDDDEDDVGFQSHKIKSKFK